MAARLRKMVPYNAVAIYLLRGDKLIPEYVTGDDFRVFSSLQIPMGEGLSGWVAQNRKSDIERKSIGRTWVPQRDACGQLHVGRRSRCRCCAAMTKCWGYWHFTNWKPTLSRRIICASCLRSADKIAASIENAIKYQAAADSAKVDYLTGLPNARSLFLHLDTEIARCTREQANWQRLYVT